MDWRLTIWGGAQREQLLGLIDRHRLSIGGQIEHFEAVHAACADLFLKPFADQIRHRPAEADRPAAGIAFRRLEDVVIDG